MKDLIELLSTYSISSIVMMIVLLISAFFGIREIVLKIKTILNDYSDNRNKIKNKENDIEERLIYLEKSDKEGREQLSSFRTDVQEVRKLIEKVQENQNAANRASCRSAMMRLSNELIQKGYASAVESETLNDLVGVFMKSAGPGDGYVVPQIVRRAMNLDVLTDEEITEIEARKAKAARGGRRKKWR